MAGGLSSGLLKYQYAVEQNSSSVSQAKVFSAHLKTSFTNHYNILRQAAKLR